MWGQEREEGKEDGAGCPRLQQSAFLSRLGSLEDAEQPPLVLLDAFLWTVPILRLSGSSGDMRIGICLPSMGLRSNKVDLD